MTQKVGKYLCCKNDPIRFAVLTVAKYLDVEIEMGSNRSCSELPHFITKDGEKIESFFSAVETMVSSISDSNFLPKDKSEIDEIKSKTKEYQDFLFNFINKTEMSNEEHRPTKIKESVTNGKEIMHTYYTHLKNLNLTLKDKTFLVGEQITPADLVAFSSVYYLYLHVLSEKTRKAIYPHLTRWFDLISHKKNVQENLPKDFKICTSTSWEEFETFCKSQTELSSQVPVTDKTPVTNVPLKFPMNTWKTTYNNDDSKTSIEWFWNNFDPEELSIYKVVYNYPDELNSSLIAKNLIIGFFQRIEAASRTSFGVLMVLGSKDKPQIMGYMILPGNKIHAAIESSPDYDSYTFTKVDPTKSEVKKEINQYLAWEDKIEGLQFLDAKTFQ